MGHVTLWTHDPCDDTICQTLAEYEGVEWPLAEWQMLASSVRVYKGLRETGGPLEVMARGVPRSVRLLLEHTALQLVRRNVEEEIDPPLQSASITRFEAAHQVTSHLLLQARHLGVESCLAGLGLRENIMFRLRLKQDLATSRQLEARFKPRAPVRSATEYRLVV